MMHLMDYIMFSIMDIYSETIDLEIHYDYVMVIDEIVIY